MTLQTFADKLGHRQWGYELPMQLGHCAKENDFLLIYGCSSNRIVAEGAFSQSIDIIDDCYLDFDQGVLHQVSQGRIRVEHDDIWKITTNLPHATFKTYDGDNLYCEGIIIQLR
jgi:hypothetical protein